MQSTSEHTATTSVTPSSSPGPRLLLAAALMLIPLLGIVLTSSHSGSGRGALPTDPVNPVMQAPARPLAATANAPARPAMGDFVANPQTASNSVNAGSLDDLANKLQQRLQQQTPDDAGGWFLLGRTWMNLQRYDDAVIAFSQHLRLQADSLDGRLALADALTLQGRDRQRAAGLVNEVLQQQPQNHTALWLAGTLAAARQQAAEALDYWQTLLPLLANEPEEQQKLQQQIRQLQQHSGQMTSTTNQPVASAASQPLTSQPETTTVSSASALGSPALKVMVTLDDSLRDQVSPDALVFVYARAMQGPRMPVAAARFRVADLPLEVVLDDSKAMMAQLRLSNTPLVMVGARISASGNPVAQSGDPEAELGNISNRQTDTLTLNIRQRHP